MFSIDVADLFPRFLLNDKNGYAMAKAIEAGLKYFLEKCQDGLDCVLDVEKMPEWRLDEMAWELNCLYDYAADVEAKRAWIRDATPLFASYGTPSAIYNYLAGYFDGIEVEEFWQYDGDPFHFRVTVDGEWTPENEAWARKAIAAAKNVRSVLDDMRLGCNVAIGIDATGQIKDRFRFPSAGEIVAGEYPTENMLWKIDETPNAAIEVEDVEGKVAYRMAGTYPNITHGLVIDETPKAGIEVEDVEGRVAYPLVGTYPAGVYPNIAQGLVVDETPAQADEAEEVITPIYYPMCGEFSCGEIE